MTLVNILGKASTYWSEVFEGLDITNTRITGKQFESCSFKNCNFSGSVFKECGFTDCEFINCNLSLLDVTESRFSEVLFSDAKLVGIDWTKAFWSRILLDSPFKFYKCILSESTFYGLSSRPLVLEDCKAHDVDFREADLTQSSFTYTDFLGSLFHHTILKGADFTEATDYDINIYHNDISGAKFTRFEAVRLLTSLDVVLED